MVIVTSDCNIYTRAVFFFIRPPKVMEVGSDAHGDKLEI